MARKDAVVDFISSLTPQAGGHRLLFANGVLATLRPGGMAAVHHDILASLHRANRPVYVELGEDGEVTRLLIPMIARLVKLEPVENGDILVQLDPSAAAHWLRRADPDFAELRQLLEHRSAGWLLVSESDAHEIVDVRPFHGTPPRARRSLKTESEPGHASGDGSVSLAKAREMFDLARAGTCEPVTADAPCIPFLYPDDGCFARAHEMCRRFVAAGVEPAKVWTPVYFFIVAKTANHAACKVSWIYHVAPTVRVSDGGATQTYVIDPSLCGEPVTESEWLNAMGNPPLTLLATPWEYYMVDGRPDPDFEDTEMELERFRLNLRLRSAEPAGPPPYANCG